MSCSWDSRRPLLLDRALAQGVYPSLLSSDNSVAMPALIRPELVRVYVVPLQIRLKVLTLLMGEINRRDFSDLWFRSDDFLFLCLYFFLIYNFFMT